MIIIALDFESAAPARELVARLGEQATHYKVGLQLLTEAGPDFVRELVEAGKQVFLDLKLYEIPNSVAGAVKAAGKLGVTMVTVHASAGSQVLQAAVEAARAFPNLRIVALTVITSLSDADLPEVGLAPSVDEQVRRLALLAAGAGCHGVVAAVREATYLRTLLPPETMIICPGIQLPGAAGTDQARVATPQLALQSGATHIIMGRAVTSAADPVNAYRSALAAFNNDH